MVRGPQVEAVEEVGVPNQVVPLTKGRFLLVAYRGRQPRSPYDGILSNTVRAIAIKIVLTFRDYDGGVHFRETNLSDLFCEKNTLFRFFVSKDLSYR